MLLAGRNLLHDDPLGLFAVHGWDAAIEKPGEEGAKYDSQRFPVQPGSSWSFLVVARANVTLPRHLDAYP